MTITVAGEGEGPPLSILTVAREQVALRGVLRRLYSLGQPLISAVCIDCSKDDEETG